ncbi:MAG: ATP-binding protein [Streptomyces sp.]|uniref:ATP-binding protein n=1 Tax=Streptomyces sp. TaxID=1931 RepID=UPI003D6C6D97
MHRESFELPADAAAVSDARERVCGQLRDWGLPEDVGHAAQLVISEFFTNVVVHTDTDRVRCRLQTDGQRLRIEVFDEGGGLCDPTPREAEPEDVNGRGLKLVNAVAETWGVQSGVRPGRLVWAELSLPAR